MERRDVVEAAQSLVTFEGKRDVDAESLETLKQAEEDSIRFLEGLGFPQAADKIRGFVDSGKVFFFTNYIKGNPAGEEEYRFEPGGFYSREHDAVGIHENVLSYDGQPGVYKVAVHEFMHLASFVADATGLRGVDRHWGTAVRLQAGFDIFSYPATGGETSEVTTKGFFVSLNEGITETLASMIDPSGWNKPDGYHVQRYLLQVLLRGMVEEKRAAGVEFTLQNAWNLIMTDYFNNTFTFAKELDTLFGAGTTRELAQLTPLMPMDSPNERADKVRREEAFIARIGKRTNLPIGPKELAELRESRRAGNMLATVKRLEDETKRAAHSVPPLRQAA